MCILFVYTSLKVVSKKKFGWGWVGGGVSSIQVYFGFF